MTLRNSFSAFYNPEHNACGRDPSGLFHQLQRRKPYLHQPLSRARREPLQRLPL